MPLERPSLQALSPTEQPKLQALVGYYIYALALILLLSPSALTYYLYVNQGVSSFYHAPIFHEIIIPIAIAFSAFVSFITFRCYQLTGKSFQRWLLMGLLAFTLIYAPHGFLTSTEQDNPWLFILYGPTSRLVMGACFLVAIFHFGINAPAETAQKYYPILRQWIAFCLLIVIVVGLVAMSPIAGETALRWGMEIPAIIFCIAGSALILLRRFNNQLLLIYAAALCLFAQSSLAFLFCPAWSHLWWYAHLIFASGFGLLSYGIARAFKNTGSFEDIYSQEELLRNLRVANAKLARSNNELSQYGHLISHDLQAPIRHISNFVYFLRENLGNDISPASRGYFDEIESSVSRMGQLIRSMLELSSIDPQSLSTSTVDLNQLIEEVQEIFIEELHSNNAQLEHTQLPIVEADRVLLFQVFQNLIQNAIKYRRADTPLEIDISYSASDSDHCIAVADNGSGFDVSEKDKVFQMFGRLHSEEVAGTGAGLAICSKIVNLHGGHLEADAEPGKGATFYVFLPKHPAQKNLAF